MGKVERRLLWLDEGCPRICLNQKEKKEKQVSCQAGSLRMQRIVRAAWQGHMASEFLACILTCVVLLGPALPAIPCEVGMKLGHL